MGGSQSPTFFFSRAKTVDTDCHNDNPKLRIDIIVIPHKLIFESIFPNVKLRLGLIKRGMVGINPLRLLGESIDRS